MLHERNIALLSNLEGNQQNYITFNGMLGKMDDFIPINSPWFLIYVIATNCTRNKEPHIISCHCRRHYYFIELVTSEVLLLRFKNLACVENCLLANRGQSILVSKLRGYGPLHIFLHLMCMTTLHT